MWFISLDWRMRRGEPYRDRRDFKQWEHQVQRPQCRDMFSWNWKGRTCDWRIGHKMESSRSKVDKAAWSRWCKTLETMARIYILLKYNGKPLQGSPLFTKQFIYLFLIMSSCLWLIVAALIPRLPYIFSVILPQPTSNYSLGLLKFPAEIIWLAQFTLLSQVTNPRPLAILWMDCSPYIRCMLRSNQLYLGAGSCPVHDLD